MLLCKHFRVLVTEVVAMALLASCSAVKIETGQTHDEKVASAEEQAGWIRSDWARRIQQANPPVMAQLLINHVDSVTARYVAYGLSVAVQWREGNAGRGKEVPDLEMRKVVAAWTADQQPILDAYEDNLEYALDRIKATGHFSQDFVDFLGELAEIYYKVYSAVFYPSGTVEDYEATLEDVTHDEASASARCKAELDRY